MPYISDSAGIFSVNRKATWTKYELGAQKLTGELREVESPDGLRIRTRES